MMGSHNETDPVSSTDTVGQNENNDYIRFKCLPPGEKLNRWSQILTREHDFPGAQVRTPHCPALEYQKPVEPRLVVAMIGCFTPNFTSHGSLNNIRAVSRACGP